MIVASLLGPLVPSVREPTKAGLLERAALVAAVALPAVVGPADDERPRAAAADQLEAGYVVDHPARMARNWTGASGSGTVRTYWLPIRRRYTRVQAVTWALIRFIRRSGLHEPRGHRDFLAAVLGQQAHQPVVPWSPAIPVGMVPFRTGGDTRPAWHAAEDVELPSGSSSWQSSSLAVPSGQGPENPLGVGWTATSISTGIGTTPTYVAK